MPDIIVVSMMNSNFDQRVLTAGMVGTVGFFGLCYYLLSRRQTKEYQHVGTVSKLFLHPVKSFAGFEVQEGYVTNRGFMSNGLYDRSFMVIDENNHFVTARKIPRMGIIHTCHSHDWKHIILSAEGKPDISIPLQQEGELVHSKVWCLNITGIDCGDEVATWISEFLEGTYRLIYCSEELPGKRLHDHTTVGHLMKKSEVSLYQDNVQFTMLSEASVADLNTRLEEQVTVPVFRPTICVKDCSAYAEDFWKYVKVGFNAELRFTHFCTRCKMTTLNKETGTYTSVQPLKTLKEYRQCYDFAEHRQMYGATPIFSTNLNAVTEGIIRVGDPVYASLQYEEHMQN